MTYRTAERHLDAALYLAGRDMIPTQNTDAAADYIDRNNEDAR